MQKKTRKATNKHSKTPKRTHRKSDNTKEPCDREPCQIICTLVPTLTDDEIIRRIFPKGLDDKKVWQNFIAPLVSPGQRRIDRLQTLIDPIFHLRGRIVKCFPTDADLLEIIKSADIPALQKITDLKWKLARQYAKFSRRVIVHEGDNLPEIFLDFAINVVIVIMLKRAKPNIFD